MNKLLVTFPLLLCFSSCEQQEGQSTPQTDGTDLSPHKEKESALITAASIAYDNAGSRLADRSVQGALDELAARAEGIEDAHDRIKTEILEKDSVVGITSDSLTIDCPGIGENSGRALGGSCGVANAPNVTLHSTDLGEAWFKCRWNKPKNSTPTLTAKVTCLSPAQ